jgi:uncharacterized membrane protein HdeD (DUF308 family)
LPAGVRRTASDALVVLTGVLLVVAALVGYARMTVVDSGRFADRATATLRDGAVRTLVAERVTDELVLANRSDLLAARPLIISAVSGLVGGEAFGSLFHRGALDVHRAVFDRDQNTVTLTLVDVGTVAGEALREVRPKLARQLEDSGRVQLVSRKVGSVAGDLARLGDRIRMLAVLLAGLTVLAAAAALVASTDRRRTVARLGVASIAAGVAVVVAYVVARVILLAGLHDPDERAAAAAVWREFLGDLRSLGLVLAGAGAIAAAAASSLIAPDELETRARRVWRIVLREPANTWLRVLRGLVLIAAGVLVVAEPTAALQVVAVFGGVVLVHEGAQALLRLIYRPPRRRPEHEAQEPQEPRRWRRLAVGAAAALAIAATGTVFIAAGGVDEPSAAVQGCNGSVKLCAKRLDQVVLPATHNAMSVPLAGWFSSEQDTPIAEQLQDGIRGLLLDTHYADKLSATRFRTDFDSPADLREAIKQDGASDHAVQAALRLRDRLGFRGEGTRGMYLCHTFCELGATPLEDVLDDLHTFLVTHPGEVVVMVNQDYVTPADFVTAVREADLEPLVFTPREGEPLPTLGEMVRSGRRLVLLAENHAGAAPWYQLAYRSLVEETPYTFPSTADLTTPSRLPASCAPNRGPERAPLFLINHWVSTDPVPRPADAAKVNAYRPLLQRARECQRIRGHLPNLLAVNFYKRGDLFGVVDTLNGVTAR